MNRYRLRLLGDPVLYDVAGAPVQLWRTMVGLLGLLGGSPDGCVVRERAATLLWPDSDQAAARRALRQLLFRLRRIGPLLEADRFRIHLDRGRLRVDVLEFEAALRDGRLEEAASLYAGPFLNGFTLPGNPEFDPWCDAERERLRRKAATVFEALTEGAIARGRWDAAAATAGQWLDLDPYSELAAGRAIAVQAQRGDRGAALALFESFRRRLDAELGARPTLALEGLAGRVERLPPRPGMPRPDPGAGDPPFQLPLLGREEEWTALAERWAEAERGSHQLVLMRGEPGIGKTRLAQDFRQWVATSGATTLGCAAYEIEAGVPYASLAGALREALHAPGLAGVEARTLSELGRIVPDYASRFPTALGSPETGLDAGHFRILEAWRDLLDSLVHEAPVLLVVDDLPWADDASLAAIHYAWRNMADRPLMILATARGSVDEELGRAAALVAAAVRDAPDAVTTTVLGPLDGSAIVAAAAAQLGASRATPTAPTGLERRSGGNPLFLTELLRAAADGLGEEEPTATIRRVTLDRVGRLPPGARALLDAAAVLGRQFPLPLAAAVAELSPLETADGADTLLSRGLIRQVGYGYDFAHGIVRDVVRDAIGTGRRAVLHQRAFSALKPEPGEDPGTLGAERIGALARHAAAAGLTAEAHRWHLLAGRAAFSLFAPAEAAQALARALDFATTPPERLATWNVIAELARARSDFRGAAVAFREALPLAEAAADRLRLRLGMLHMGERSGLLTAADVDALAADMRPEAEAAGPAYLGQLLFVLGDAHGRARSWDSALGWARAAVDAFRAAGAPRRLVRALLLRARIEGHTGRGDPLAALDEAERVAREHGLDLELRDVRVEQATELSRTGRWDAATVALEQVRVELAEAGDWGNCAIACLNVADLHARRGQWADAGSALAEADRIAERFAFPHVPVVASLNRALLEWLRGDLPAAIAFARDAGRAGTAAGLAPPAAAAAALQALVLLEQGEDRAAEAVLARVGPGFAATAHPSWSDDIELLHAARARLMASRGDIDGARSVLGSALAGTREPYARAFLTLEQARLEQRVEPKVARMRAAEAARELHALGATPLAARADELAAAALPVSRERPG